MTFLDIEQKVRSLSRALQLVSLKDYEAALKAITRKLNKKYYNTPSEVDHMFIVGSVGRGTAALGESDVDVIFVLPDHVKERFDARAGNVQSALLQEIKSEIADRYPRTELKGDGQVVVVDFNRFKVELVPAFNSYMRAFLHPDSNDGGKWKETFPEIEQEAVWDMQKLSQGNYGAVCTILRLWREVKNVHMSGFLIDSLVYDWFQSNKWDKGRITGDLSIVLTSCIVHIGRQNEWQNSWYSLGSGVAIKNPDEGLFIRKAAKFATALEEAANSPDEMDKVFEERLGTKYDAAVNIVKGNARAIGEQFIEEESIIALNSLTSLDCRVTQDGFRPFSLRGWLSEVLNGNRRFLSINKSLDFFITETAVTTPHDIKWKVRNVGEEAIRRHDERGKIMNGGIHHVENSRFTGNHYVECYIEKNGICLSRTRIDVPINSDAIDHEHRN